MRVNSFLKKQTWYLFIYNHIIVKRSIVPEGRKPEDKHDDNLPFTNVQMYKCGWRCSQRELWQITNISLLEMDNARCVQYRPRPSVAAAP